VRHEPPRRSPIVGDPGVSGRFAKLDAAWHQHPKILATGFDGMGLHAWAMSYCMHWLTDGYVPSAALPNLPRPKETVKALVKAGLFEPAPNGFILHDYLQWQLSRDQLQATRESDAARKRGSKANTGFPVRENGQFSAPLLRPESGRNATGGAA